MTEDAVGGPRDTAPRTPGKAGGVVGHCHQYGLLDGIYERVMAPRIG